ncbi:unnamed protein product [Toxocara canis]|uniref:Uncharacterized protein n=1 Tax=Toxocara canis TaxID=6265 RepID=A0A183UHR9_TOXCA|nr:unnamed protein product [Toxocara canis]
MKNGTRLRRALGEGDVKQVELFDNMEVRLDSQQTKKQGEYARRTDVHCFTNETLLAIALIDLVLFIVSLMSVLIACMTTVKRRDLFTCHNIDP